MFPVQALARMAVHNERWSLALMRYAQKRTSLVCVASNNFAARRYINTTNKNKDHSTVDVYDPEYVGVKKPKGPETPKEFADVGKQKNWISYGFDYVDYKTDRQQTHLAFFCFITMGLVVLMWCVYYFPDPHKAEWALREAFLELDRRERLGLPLIDPNYVDPAKIELPSEEELVGVEILY